MLSRSIFGRVTSRRILALVACGALLYFAIGATLPHEHAQGPDGACHVCQALHMPALASAWLDLATAPEIVARYSSLLLHATPTDSFSLQHAGRAPPAD